VPYQQPQAAERLSVQPPIVPVQTESPIKSTARQLLEGFDDQQWVYWCIDEKYPIALATDVLDQIAGLIQKDDSVLDGVDGLLCCRTHSHLVHNGPSYQQGRRVNLAGQDFFRRTNFMHIWVHQFLRVGVLRHLFNGFPDHIPNAKVMDDLLHEVH